MILDSELVNVITLTDEEVGHLARLENDIKDARVAFVVARLELLEKYKLVDGGRFRCDFRGRYILENILPESFAPKGDLPRAQRIRAIDGVRES